MSGVPDYTLEETLDFKFTSRAFATGIPTVLAGSPVIEIYEDNSTTQIIDAETLTVDFDSVVGLNNLRVVATAANGFEAGKSYQASLSAGTVGGVSVVGEVVQQFSMERSPVNWANVTAPSTANDLSATDIQLVDTTTANTDMRGTDSALLAASINLTGGAVDVVTTLTNKTGFSLAATGLDAIVSTATGMVAIAKAVWDRIISMANHNIGQSAGKILRQSGDLVQIDGAVSDVNPAKGGFDTNLTQVDDFFEDSVMIFSNGSANAGIGLPVSTYLNANGAVTFASPDQWPVTPVNGDDFVIFATHVHPVAQIADAVWDEDLTGHTTVDSAGKAVSDIEDDVTAILEDTGTTIPATLGTPADTDMSTDIAAVKADTVIPEKNVAFSNISVLMVDDTDHVTPKTGLSVTGQRSIDGGAFANVTGSIAEISNGIYQFDASQADMNGDVITFKFSGTAADDTFLTVVTR